LSPAGTIIWFKTFDSGANDFAWDTAVDNNGDVVISGGYGGTLFGHEAWRDGSALWMKLSGVDGSFKWMQTAGVPLPTKQSRPQ
jgi:hypothetical protein